MFLTLNSASGDLMGGHCFSFHMTGAALSDFKGRAPTRGASFAMKL